MGAQSKAFWKYQRCALTSAWHKTWKWSPLTEKQTLFTVVALITTWFVTNELGIQEELVNAIGVITVGVWVAFFISQRIMAPARILHEIENERDQLREKFVPKLRLEFIGGNDPRYFRKESTYRNAAFISVHNDSAVDITDIDVTCDEVMALSMDAEEVPLRVIGTRHPFDLHGNTHEFLRVLHHNIDDTDRPGILEVVIRSPLKTNAVIRSTAFHLRIGARGTQGAALPLWLDCFVINRTLFVKRLL